MPRASKTDEVLEQGVRNALAWLGRHPGRDALDAATAAVMEDKHATAHDLGTKRWGEFLDAVREAVGQLA